MRHPTLTLTWALLLGAPSCSEPPPPPAPPPEAAPAPPKPEITAAQREARQRALQAQQRAIEEVEAQRRAIEAQRAAAAREVIDADWDSLLARLAVAEGIDREGQIRAFLARHASAPNPHADAARELLGVALGVNGSRRAGKAGITWVHLEGGSIAPRRGAAKTRLTSLSISRTEITVAQYRACVEAGACAAPLSPEAACNWGREGRDAHPINCVTWGEAVAFAAWAGGRLPSAAEWAFAATNRGLKWPAPWGAAAPSCARVVMHDQGQSGCGAGGTARICAKPKGRSALGLCDLLGNVEEWLGDTPEGETRLTRGGGWSSPAAALSPWSERRVEASTRSPTIGLRLAR